MNIDKTTTYITILNSKSPARDEFIIVFDPSHHTNHLCHRHTRVNDPSYILQFFTIGIIAPILTSIHFRRSLLGCNYLFWCIFDENKIFCQPTSWKNEMEATARTLIFHLSSHRRTTISPNRRHLQRQTRSPIQHWHRNALNISIQLFPKYKHKQTIIGFNIQIHNDPFDY